MKTIYTKGDTFQYPNADCELVWQSGLHIPAINHYQAVVFYGATKEEAESRRDEAFEVLSAAVKP